MVALSRTSRGDAQLAALGVRPVRGDLCEPGRWQHELAGCDWLVHVAQPDTFGVRVSRRRAERYAELRLVMDRNLLEAARRGGVRRAVYVAGTSYYGDLGAELRDESAPRRPRGWGRYVAPGVQLWADARDLEVIQAFPGYVYGAGSWFEEYVLAPLRRGKAIHTIAGRSRHASFIHVDDCARALAHLLVHGAGGERYFVVDDEPHAWVDFYGRAAAALGVPYRLRRIPVPLLRAAVGPVITDSLLSESVLSNRKLRASGFALAYPTIASGIPAVVAGSSAPTMS